MMEGVPVTLIIKAPHQQIDDQVIKCHNRWTVQQLKEHLAEVYPNKPESSKQKLIYSGQLLNDSSCLKDILRQHDGLEDQSYIVHLVCGIPKVCANTTGHQANIESIDTNSTTSDITNLRNMGQLDSNNIQNSNEMNSNVDLQSLPPQFYLNQPNINTRNNQQITWMLQAYTQYLTQYMQFMAAQGVQFQDSAPNIQQMNINMRDNLYNIHINNNNNNLNNNNNNNNNNNENEPPQVAREAVDNNVGNNNGGDEANVGFHHHDWLDCFYMLSRIIVLFSIVYFYSSPLRFLVVTFLGFAIYLYQGGFFRVQPILVAENNNIFVDNNNQGQQNEIVVPPQNGQVPDVEPEGRTDANDNNEEVRPGALAYTWTFFSSFFASLIPDQPNVI